MITLLSPAKTLDFETTPSSVRFSIPVFLDRAATLIEILRERTPADLQQLMKQSDDLAELNTERNRTWRSDLHYHPGESRQALYAFRGEVYRGLDADTLNEQDLSFAQEHLVILSGLYGTLRPLDLIMPYRLEMGARLENSRGATLYRFWGDSIAERMNTTGATIVNLASREYFRSVGTGALKRPVITPVFQDRSNHGPRVIAVYAKKQRGRMARYILDNRIRDPEALKQYDTDGYRYDPSRSTGSEWVFVR